MTVRFTKVSSALWRSKRFKSLPTDTARLLYLYFCTSEHQTSIGAYRLPDGYALDDLGWDLKTYKAARQQLVEAELIRFDSELSTLYVLRWFKHSPPMNESHAQGCARLIGELESDPIREVVEADFLEASERRNPIPDPPSSATTYAFTGKPNNRFPVVPGAAARGGR